MKDNRIYIEHIISCLQKILNYIEDLDQDKFVKNTMVQDAVIRQFEVIGEATKRLSTDLRLQYPDIPWRQMAGMRDKLIHDYIDVDLNTVWLSAKYEAIELLIAVEEVQKSFE